MPSSGVKAVAIRHRTSSVKITTLHLFFFEDAVEEFGAGMLDKWTFMRPVRPVLSGQGVTSNNKRLSAAPLFSPSHTTTPDTFMDYLRIATTNVRNLRALCDNTPDLQIFRPSVAVVADICEAANLLNEKKVSGLAIFAVEQTAELIELRSILIPEFTRRLGGAVGHRLDRRG
ncbi:hypothetical protein B0H14DRAFT_2598813 [Mycena olivaceomarginata]|nr:hypothetical protein B0H14DRAFT_2598813 [Mycena olivaceomarginata]